MNIRPRCREWLPLSTQQLRLRNLSAIQGINIECNQTDCCSCSPSSSSSSTSVSPEAAQADTYCACPATLVYFTLHDHPENEPFYESEKLPLRLYLPVKWAEIHCLSMIKSNANCVCIKVWAKVKKTSTATAEGQNNNNGAGLEDNTKPRNKEPIR